jgi:putative transposase
MRQTYYGAIDCQTRIFQLRAYPAGDSHSTIKFIEYLRSLYPQSQLMLIWDGASYHHSILVKHYLAKLNQGLTTNQRLES